MITDLIHGEHCRACRRPLSETFRDRLGPWTLGPRTIWGVLCSCGVTNLLLFVEDIVIEDDTQATG